MCLSLHIDGTLRKRRILEFINECTILNSIYHVLLFTDFVASAETKYSLGWSVSFFILLTVLFQLSIVIYKMVRAGKNKCKLWRAKRKAA